VRFRYGLSSRSEAYLSRLDAETRRRVAVRLDQLAEDPFDPRLSKPLTNLAGLRSSRIGALRIVYRVVTSEQTFRVETIAPRGQVYRDL
jgi:mRNA interferase RelE/StbE